MTLTRLAVVCLAFALPACGGASPTETIVDGTERACRSIEAEDDGFGSTVRYVTIWDDLATGAGSGVLELRKTGDDVRLRAGVWLAPLNDFTLPAGTLVELRLATEEVVSFTSDVDITGTTSGSGWMGFRTEVMMPFALTDEELATLGSADWLGLRITPPSGDAWTMPIVESDSDQMVTAARCFAF